MSRRVIQPPGGQSNIFLGSDAPDNNCYKSQFQQNTEKKVAADNQQKNGGSNNQGGDQQQEVKKQTSESAESTLGRSDNASNESKRNKDQQKSSIVFGNDDNSASQSAAHNKAGQTHRNYNLITGEAMAEDTGAKNGTQSKKVEEPKSQDAPINKPSTKVHHPPGGKSSGPLW